MKTKDWQYCEVEGVPTVILVTHINGEDYCFGFSMKDDDISAALKTYQFNMNQLSRK